MSIFELTPEELQRVEQRVGPGICTACRAQLNYAEQCQHIYCPQKANTVEVVRDE